MQFTEPRRKKSCRLPAPVPLPIILKRINEVYKFKATFNGFSVEITDLEDMKKLVSMGYFGKACLSRSYPQFQKESNNSNEVMRKRQFEKRREFFKTTNKPSKVIIVPDSDDEDDYFKNLKPTFDLDYSNLKEFVNLSREEAMFLNSSVKCLDICFDGKFLSSEEVWQLFSKTCDNFIRNYVVYYYYRSRNWVVKTGIKFGGDFLLYKQGPPFYHASYVVVIEESGLEAENQRKLDSTYLAGLNRLCETSGKELLICKLFWPKTKPINLEDLKEFKIEEILMKRWIPSEER